MLFVCIAHPVVYSLGMAADKSKTMSIRLDNDEVVAIESHLERLRAKTGGIPYNFSDAMKHLLSVGIEHEERASQSRKRA